MSKENDKIYISNSPFVNGHKIVDFYWSARLDENFNFVMDLHLETDQYDEEEEYADFIDEINNISEENTEKSLWINYGHCVISSTFWNNKGIPINLDQPFDFTTLNNKVFTLDPLPVDLEGNPEDLAFGISMLGKDTIANNEITFLDTEEFGHFDIKWKAKVANTYADENTFDYEIYLFMKNVKFAGIRISTNLSKKKVLQFLEKNFIQFDAFELIEDEEFGLEDYLFKLKTN